MSPVPEVSVAIVAALLNAPNPPLLLDVREKFELEIASIGGVHIPLAEIPARLGEVPVDREIIVYCRSGSRSERAAAFLIQNGRQAKNLRGGIIAWSREIDSEVAEY